MSEPATKTDLLELEQRLDGRMGELEQRLDGRMGELEQRLDGRMGELEQGLESRLKEFMRDIETNMLTAFHSYAQSNDLRLRKVEADLNNVSSAETLRFAVIESRLLAVEHKIHTLGRS